MKAGNIEISGVITQENLKSYNLQYPRREICETFGINFSEDMPKVESPLQVFFDTEVVESKVISTQGENKVLMHGVITTKIVYVAEKPSSSINSVEFYKHFSCMLPINNTNSLDITTKAFIEEAIVTQERNKGFYVSLLILICPIYSVDANKYEEITVVPKQEQVNKTGETRELTEKISIPAKNKDVDIELEYDMSMKNQYFESSWK